MPYREGSGKEAAGWAPIFAANPHSAPAIRQMARGPTRVSAYAGEIEPITLFSGASPYFQGARMKGSPGMPEFLVGLHRLQLRALHRAVGTNAIRLPGALCIHIPDRLRIGII